MAEPKETSPNKSEQVIRVDTGRRLAILFLVPLAFSLIFLTVTLLSEHTDIDLLEIERLSASIGSLRTVATDLESGERGYLLTDDQAFLAPYKHAMATLDSQIKNCLRYAEDGPDDLRDELRSLISAIRQRSALARDAVTVAQSKGRHAAVDSITSGEGDRLMNVIRGDIDRLQRRLSREEESYVASQRRLNHSAFFVFIAGTGILVVVLYRLYGASLRYLRQRDESDERLHHLNLSLEAQVEERTRDLRIVNEELQQFAYVASHDLQEPLRTITSFSQLVEARYRDQLDDDAKEFIGYIVTSARRMTDLINGLLTLVRLRRAGQNVDPVSFNEIVQDASVSLQASMRENNAQITCGDLPSLVVDRVQFSQLMQNLLSNAIKYRSPNDVRIHIEAHREESNWVFSVADNGRGFDPQFAERIFGLFQRLHNREAIEGTGMGLSISRKIVERHGGRIWAESMEGHGAKFFFSLPVSLEGVRERSAAS